MSYFIRYSVPVEHYGDYTGYHGSIEWVVDEDFSELLGKEFPIGKMHAVDVMALPDLSITSKVLLSAVAGALIQYLIDFSFNLPRAFEVGVFSIETANRMRELNQNSVS